MSPNHPIATPLTPPIVLPFPLLCSITRPGHSKPFPHSNFHFTHDCTLIFTHCHPLPIIQTRDGNMRTRRTAYSPPASDVFSMPSSHLLPPAHYLPQQPASSVNIFAGTTPPSPQDLQTNFVYNETEVSYCNVVFRCTVTLLLIHIYLVPAVCEFE